MKPFKPAKIYYGTKRNPKVSEALQPKDITREWFVYYSVLNPATGKFKRFTVKGSQAGVDLNRIHILKDRIVVAQDLCDMMNGLLSDGYSPYSDVPDAILDEPGARSDLNFKEALEYAYKKRMAKVDRRRKNDLNSSLNAMKDAIEQCSFNEPVECIERIHIKKIQEKWQQMGKPNKRCNRLLEDMSTLFNELIEWQAVKYNPCAGIKKLSEHEGKPVHVPLTPAERIKIKEHLTAKYPDLWDFYQFIYYEGMRISEICRLEFKDCDLDNGLIIMEHLDDQGAVKAKTKVLREIPIFPQVRDIIERRKEIVKDVPGWERYKLFSADFHATATYKPGTREMNPNTPSANWLTIVKNGLKINKTIYGGKHTRAEDLIDADISLDAVQSLFGHTSKLTTKIYAKNLKKKYNEELTKKGREL